MRRLGGGGMAVAKTCTGVGVEGAIIKDFQRILLAVDGEGGGVKGDQRVARLGENRSEWF